MAQQALDLFYGRVCEFKKLDADRFAVAFPKVG